MSTRAVDRPARIHRKLWAAKVLRDGHVIYWWGEIAAILLFYFVYSAVRNWDAAHNVEVTAFENAKQLMGWQQTLGINHELMIQHWARHFTPILVVSNYFYGSLHFIVTIGVGVYLFRKWPNDYPRWRNTLGVATAIALIGFRFWPLMPPRLLDFPFPHLHLHPGVRYGFQDTLAKYPTLWTFNSGAMKSISNQFAAMPSVHCCWALWCACALVPRLKRTWAKWLAAGYPVMTVSVIVITGNHYFLDAVGGFVIFGIGYTVARLCTRAGRGPAIEPEPVPAT
ncbi:MAG: phosphatase PAP2 family protein [Acidimicrobiia bacterium]